MSSDQPLLYKLRQKEHFWDMEQSDPLVFHVGIDEKALVPREDVIDVIFENYVSLNGICEQHPYCFILLYGNSA